MGMLLFDSRSTIAGTNQVVNTFHVGCASQPTITEANAVIAAVNAFYNGFTAYRVNSTNSITGSRVLYAVESAWQKPTFDANGNVLTKGKWTTEPVILGVTPTTSATGTGGAQTPPQLASVISWRTAVSGRSGRGRTYLGNLGASAQNGAFVAGAAATAINTAAATLLTAIAGVAGAAGPYNLGVWSPTKGRIQPILSGVSDNTFDTMRSRVK